MAILIPTLTLSSTKGTTGVSEDATLALSVTDSLSVTDPSIGISRVACTNDGTDTEILPSADVTRYLYIKNTGLDASDVATTAHIKVETANGYRIIDLAPDEFCFLPHHAEAAGIVQLETSAGTVVAEYAYWTKA